MSKEMREQINKVKNWKQFLNEGVDVENNSVDLVHTGYGYDFYIGKDNEGKTFYNIVPMGDNKPNGGYYSSEFICKNKGVKNVFKTVEKEREEIKNMISDKLKKNGF